MAKFQQLPPELQRVVLAAERFWKTTRVWVDDARSLEILPIHEEDTMPIKLLKGLVNHSASTGAEAYEHAQDRAYRELAAAVMAEQQRRQREGIDP